MIAPSLILGQSYCFTCFYNQSGDQFTSARYITIFAAEYKNDTWVYYEKDGAFGYKESDLITFA